MPDWVLSPESAGFQYASVGSAMPQKMGNRAQYKMAEFAAKKEYATNKNVYINSQPKQYWDTDDHAYFESDSSQYVGELIRFSHFSKQNEWKDPESGELFLLYATTD
jgi:hypothetical protein